jgi:hypothetical protein
MMKKELKRINKNYLEPEFEIAPHNSFKKIMDFNLKGGKRFSNLFPK